MKTLKSRWFIVFLAFVFIPLSALLLGNKNNQDIDWTFPYFSGAANFEELFRWQISPSDFEHARRLSKEDYRNYKHQRTVDLVPNTFNSYGYVLVALLSRTLFPFLGDLNGAILLQVLVHLAVSVFILLKLLTTSFQRYIFLLLYACNPLIIHFATFPHYYFWMFLPSLSIVVLILKPKWCNLLVFLAVPILLFALAIRPTTLFLVCFFFVLAFHLSEFRAERWRIALAAGLLIVGVGFITTISTSSPWHTAYVGVGAYKNDFGVSDLGDHQGFAYYLSQTGVTIETDPIHGNWKESKFRAVYMEILQKRYFEIIAEDPWQFFRNAVINFLQVFSVGYIVGHPFMTWLNTVFGFLFLFFLISTRQYIWMLAVISSALGFFWYFPPIPAYNFAAYLLLVVGGLAGLESWVKRRQKNNTQAAG